MKEKIDLDYNWKHYDVWLVIDPPVLEEVLVVSCLWESAHVFTQPLSYYSASTSSKEQLLGLKNESKLVQIPKWPLKASSVLASELVPTEANNNNNKKKKR